MTIFEANKKFQRSLNYGLAVAHDAVLRAYAEAYAGLEERLAALAAKIAREESPPQAWLWERARVEALKRDFAEEILRVASKATKIGIETQSTLIAEAKTYAAASANAAAIASGVRINFQAVPDDQLRAFVGITSNGSPLRTAFDEIGQELGIQSGQSIDRAILKGIASGFPPKVMVREILKEAKLETGTGTDPAVASRLYMGVHSSALNSAREATRTTYAKSDIRRYRWTSSRNRRTCPVCWGLDGVIFETSEPMTPHLLCRCTLVPYLGVDLFEDTGPEAFEKLPEEDKRFILGAKSFAAYKDGKVKVGDFVGVANDPVWGKYYTRRSLTSILGIAEAKKYGVHYPKPVLQHQSPTFAPHPKKIQPLVGLKPKKPPGTGGAATPAASTPPSPPAARVPFPRPHAPTPTPAPPTPSVPPRPAIPHPSQLTEVSGSRLGGSTGAKLMEDAAGNRYVVKYGSSADHLREEFRADEAYRAAGVDVPEGELFDTPSGPAKVSRYVKGQELGRLEKTDPAAFEAAKAEVKKNFVLDALLANRDIPGATWDNVLVDDAGRVFRIDNGAALRYRAQGGSKSDFLRVPFDLRTMRDPAYGAGKLFHDVTVREMADQILALESKMPAILDALGDDELRKLVAERFEISKALAKGVQYLRPDEFDESDLEDLLRVYFVKVNSGKPPGLAFAMAQLEVQDGITAAREAAKNPLVKKWAYKKEDLDRIRAEIGNYFQEVQSRSAKNKIKGPNLEELSVVRLYTGSFYARVNRELRAEAEGKGKASEYVKSFEKVLNSALYKLPPHPRVVQRGMSVATPAQLAQIRTDFAEGGIYTLPNFFSTSYEGSGFGGDVRLTINQKSGRKVERFSDNPSEKEVLIPSKTQFRVVRYREVGKPLSGGTIYIELEEI